MMLLKNVYTSIDIGSDSIKVVVCELHNNKLNLLATSSVKSKGIKKGLIVNADDAQASIKEAMEEIESLLGIKINKVIASVPANNAEFTFIKGEVKIINENNVVSSDDIVKVLQSSMKAKITPEKEMVTIIPIDFRLDDAEGMQTLRVLARNMSFLIKSIALGKEKFGLPEKEEHAWTNFIR